jgi:hypothetical protein
MDVPTTRTVMRPPKYLESSAVRNIEDHHVDDVNTLLNYPAFAKPKEMKTAHAGCLHVIGSETVRFSTVAGGKERQGELHNVHYIPGLETRLISLGKLFSQGWDLCLSLSGIDIYDSKGENIMRSATRPLRCCMRFHPVRLCVWDISDDDLRRPLMALLAKERAKPISLYDWHRAYKISMGRSDFL